MFASGIDILFQDKTPEPLVCKYWPDVPFPDGNVSDKLPDDEPELNVVLFVLLPILIDFIWTSLYPFTSTTPLVVPSSVFVSANTKLSFVSFHINPLLAILLKLPFPLVKIIPMSLLLGSDISPSPNLINLSLTVKLVVFIVVVLPFTFKLPLIVTLLLTVIS